MSDKTNLPAPLKQAVEESGIALSRAEKIASNYAPFFAEMTLLGNKLKGLSAKKPEDVAAAKRIRIDLGHICVEAGKQKKADKDKLLVATRYIDGLYNTVNGFGRLTQGEAEEIEKHAQRELEAKQKKASEKREKEMIKYLVGDEEQKQNAVESMKLGEMAPDVYKMLLSSYKEQHEQRIEAEAKAEEERKRAEIAERERIAAQAKENERLKKEAEKQRKENEAAQAKIKAANELAEKTRKETEKQLREAEAAKQALINEKARVDAEIAAEEAAQEAKAKALAKAPVKKQLSDWISKFELPDAVVGKPNEDPPQVFEDICIKFSNFKKWAQEEVDKL